MSQGREKFATQVKEGRQFQALVDETLADQIERGRTPGGVRM